LIYRCSGSLTADQRSVISNRLLGSDHGHHRAWRRHRPAASARARPSWLRPPVRAPESTLGPITRMQPTSRTR